jgi:hypothetical protein
LKIRATVVWLAVCKVLRIRFLELVPAMIIKRESSVMLAIGLRCARRIILQCVPIRAIVWEKIAGALLVTLARLVQVKISIFMSLGNVPRMKKGHFVMRTIDLRLALLTILLFVLISVIVQGRTAGSLREMLVRLVGM